MTDYIRFGLDKNIFPSVKKLNEGIIQTPPRNSQNLDDFASGSYVDIRDIKFTQEI